MSWRFGSAPRVDNVDLSTIREVQAARFPAGQVDIEEFALSGAGKVTFHTSVSSIRVIPDNDNHPISWYFENKCADGAVIIQYESGLELHIVELKTKLTPDKWTLARRQLQGMLANSLSIVGALSLESPALVVCYVAFSVETVGDFISTNTVVQKQLVGAERASPDTKIASYRDFKNAVLTLLDGQVVPVKLVYRDIHGNASVTI